MQQLFNEILTIAVDPQIGLDHAAAQLLSSIKLQQGERALNHYQ